MIARAVRYSTMRAHEHEASILVKKAAPKSKAEGETDDAIDVPTGPPSTAWELAVLTVLLNREAIELGESREGILSAMKFLEECADLQEKIYGLKLEDRVELLTDGALGGSDAAVLLARVFSKQRMVPEKMLILTEKDAEDTVRPYLSEHGNLEGRKPERKSWSTVRVVKDNLRLMFISKANEHNRACAAKIEAREKSDPASQALPEVFANLVPDEEKWRDGVGDFERFLQEAEEEGGAKPARYRISVRKLDELIRWKREIRRQKGGSKAVRSLRRKEVFCKPSKQTFRKR